MLLPPELAMATEEEKSNYGYGSSSDSVFSGFGSSSSDLNGSEIDPNDIESDEDDFIAEMTRKMADYMLQEDDENRVPSSVSENTTKKSFGLSLKLPGQRIMTYKESLTNQIEDYQVSNQPQIEDKDGCVVEGRIETQKIKHENNLQTKTYQQQQQNSDFRHGRKMGSLPSLQAGPGMRMVFLGGSGTGSGSGSGLASRSGCGGTGVFLPHASATINNKQADHQSNRKKQGCSTVLIPERVLQILNLHFESKDFVGHPIAGPHYRLQSQRLQKPFETTTATKNNQDVQLPQEWTY